MARAGLTATAGAPTRTVARCNAARCRCLRAGLTAWQENCSVWRRRHQGLAAAASAVAAYRCRMVAKPATSDASLARLEATAWCLAGSSGGHSGAVATGVGTGKLRRAAGSNGVVQPKQALGSRGVGAGRRLRARQYLRYSGHRHAIAASCAAAGSTQAAASSVAACGTPPLASRVAAAAQISARSAAHCASSATPCCDSSAWKAASRLASAGRRQASHASLALHALFPGAEAAISPERSTMPLSLTRRQCHQRQHAQFGRAADTGLTSKQQVLPQQRLQVGGHSGRAWKVVQWRQSRCRRGCRPRPMQQGLLQAVSCTLPALSSAR